MPTNDSKTRPAALDELPTMTHDDMTNTTSVAGAPTSQQPFIPSSTSPLPIHDSPTDASSAQGDSAHQADSTNDLEESQRTQQPSRSGNTTPTPRRPSPVHIPPSHAPHIEGATTPPSSLSAPRLQGTTMSRLRNTSNNPFLKLQDHKEDREDDGAPLEHATALGTSASQHHLPQSSKTGLSSPALSPISSPSPLYPGTSSRQTRWSATSSTVVGSAVSASPHPPFNVGGVPSPGGGARAVPVQQRTRRNTASLDMKKTAIRNASEHPSRLDTAELFGEPSQAGAGAAEGGSLKKAMSDASSSSRPYDIGRSTRKQGSVGFAWPTGMDDASFTEGNVKRRDFREEVYDEDDASYHHQDKPSKFNMSQIHDEPAYEHQPRSRAYDAHHPRGSTHVQNHESGYEYDEARGWWYHGHDEQRYEALPDVVDTQCANPYANLNMSEEIEHLVAVTTGEYERYQRGYTYPKTPTPEYLIPPLKTTFNAPRVPDGWRAFVHPEGTRYFYCDLPEHPVPVLTEAWIYDSEIYSRLRTYMNLIFEYMRKNDIAFPSPSPPDSASRPPSPSPSPSPSPPHPPAFPQDTAPVVLVLEFRLTGRIGYYFVSHLTQTLFWLEPFAFDEMVGEVHMEPTEWMAGLQMRSQYWAHNEMFPHCYELREGDLGCVEDWVGFAIGDVLTTVPGQGGTTEPRDMDTLKQMYAIVHRYQMKGPERRRRSVGERRVICRLLQQFYNERFVNLYGERGARLALQQSIHYSPHRRQKIIDRPKRSNNSKPWYKPLLSFFYPLHSTDEKGLASSGSSVQQDTDELITEDADPAIDSESRKLAVNSLWIRVLSVVMFGSPTMHMRKLREMIVDGLVNRHSLSRYADKMVEEWRDITITGTVVLTANVSFLTIQSVDEEGTLGPNRTPAQRASYFSILASMGTIVFSLLLLRQHREAMSLVFISNRSASRWGLESLALMYGMPFALLIWSMISFFASFAILWVTSTDYVVITIASICCGAFMLVVLWAITAAYEKDPYESYASRLSRKAREAKRKVAKGTSKAVRSVSERMSAVVDAGNISSSSSFAPPAHEPSVATRRRAAAPSPPPVHPPGVPQHRRRASSMTAVGGPVEDPPEYSKEDEGVNPRRRMSMSLRRLSWYPERAWFGRDRTGSRTPSVGTVESQL